MDLKYLSGLEPKIKSRKKGRITEYYLSVMSESGGFLYHDWYTLTGKHGLVNFKECVVAESALKDRVNRFDTHKENFKDLFDCMTRPAIKTGKKVHDFVDRRENKAFNKMLLLMKVGSLTGKPLQAKQY